MNPSNEYLMILRNTDWDEGLSADEISGLVERYTAWIEHMQSIGKVKGGRPLLPGGRVISGKGDAISDGPFIESKESVGGYIVISASGYDEAVEIAKSFPPVQLGVGVELRELTDVCPVCQRLEKRLAEA